MMTIVIKQRLVGGLVLLSLAVLILPLVFSGQGRVPEAGITAIPDAPFVQSEPSSEFSLNPEDDTQSRLDRIYGMADGEAVVDDEPVAVAEPEVETGSEASGFALNDNGEAQAWSVQLGSFRNGDNARRLLEQLRGAGYEAYTRESLLSDGSNLVQVLVGPGSDIDSIRGLRSELADAFDVAPLVVRFQP